MFSGLNFYLLQCARHVAYYKDRILTYSSPSSAIAAAATVLRRKRVSATQSGIGSSASFHLYTTQKPHFTERVPDAVFNAKRKYNPNENLTIKCVVIRSATDLLKYW